MYGELYRALEGVSPSGFDLEVFVDLKRGVDYRPVSTTRNDADRKVLVNRINAMVQTVKAGIFHAAPVGFWPCTEKFCPFFGNCVYVNSERRAAAESLDA